MIVVLAGTSRIAACPKLWQLSCQACLPLTLYNPCHASSRTWYVAMSDSAIDAYLTKHLVTLTSLVSLQVRNFLASHALSLITLQICNFLASHALRLDMGAVDADTT